MRGITVRVFQLLFQRVHHVLDPQAPVMRFLLWYLLTYILNIYIYIYTLTSVSSRTGCPPDIVNDEITPLKKMSFLISRNGISPKLILKLFIKLVGLKTLFILHTKSELLNKHFLFQKLMNNAACFLKETLVNLLLLKNSVICILVLFKLPLNHLLEKV